MRHAGYKEKMSVWYGLSDSQCFEEEYVIFTCHNGSGLDGRGGFSRYLWLRVHKFNVLRYFAASCGLGTDSRPQGLHLRIRIAPNAFELQRIQESKKCHRHLPE